MSVEASPLNKHDLLVVSGVLARPPLPHIPGAEGVARVLATGPAVDGLQVGDLVVLPLYAGAWRERLVVPADSPQAKPSSHPRLTQHATRRRVRSMRVRGHPEPQRGIDAGAESSGLALVFACHRRRSGSYFAAAARWCVMVAPPLNYMYCGETSGHREVDGAASWGVPRQGQGLRRRGSEVAA